MAVHARHLEFVFEVAHRAQPAHDHTSPLLAHEVLQQSAKTRNLDVRIVTQHLARDGNALIHRKEGSFVAAVGNTDHQLGEHARRAPHEILVAARERIERSWIDGDHHQLLPRMRRRPARSNSGRIIQDPPFCSKWNRTRPAWPARSISRPRLRARSGSIGSALSAYTRPAGASNVRIRSSAGASRPLSNGGSRNTMSKAPGASRAATVIASPATTSICVASSRSLSATSPATRRASRSTISTLRAPRDASSEPKTPVPAKR